MDTSAPRPTDPTRLTLPVVEDRLELDRRTVVTGTVRIERSTETRETVVDEPLHRDTVHVERVPVGRVLADDERPAPRDDGETLVVPVVEEVLVVERRRVLKEELHVRRVREAYRAPQRVTLSSDRVEVRRFDVRGRPRDDAPASGDRSVLHEDPPPNPDEEPR